MTDEIEGFPLRSRTDTSEDRCLHYLRLSGNVNGVLALVELCCRLIASYQDYDQRDRLGITQSPADALAEVNERFRQHGVGYQYEQGEIIRVDSQFVHSEVVKPALALLSAPEFADANAEFRRAHEHYRAGRYPAIAIRRACGAWRACSRRSATLTHGRSTRVRRLSD